MGNSKSGDVLICGLQPAGAVLGAESSQVLLKIHFNLLLRLSVEDAALRLHSHHHWLFWNVLSLGSTLNVTLFPRLLRFQLWEESRFFHFRMTEATKPRGTFPGGSSPAHWGGGEGFPTLSSAPYWRNSVSPFGPEQTSFLTEESGLREHSEFFGFPVGNINFSLRRRTQRGCDPPPPPRRPGEGDLSVWISKVTCVWSQVGFDVGKIKTGRL